MGRRAWKGKKGRRQQQAISYTDGEEKVPRIVLPMQFKGFPSFRKRAAHEQDRPPEYALDHWKMVQRKHWEKRLDSMDSESRIAGVYHGKSFDR